MKKFMMAAVALICMTMTSVALSSCGDDKDDDSTTPSQSSGTYNVYASAVLDKNLAEYGYMEVTYTCKGKTETFQLMKGDTSDKFPATNDFGSKVLNYLATAYGINYTNDNFIVRNVVLTDLKMEDSAVFTYKFIAAENRPEYTEKSDFIIPGILGYATGSYTDVYSSLQAAKGVHVDKFESWLANRATEHTVTFSPNKSQN